MKVKKIVELRTHYSFEAPVLPAALKIGAPKELLNENLKVDLNSFLAPDSEKHYLVKVNGESMIEENIHDGDLLVVEKTKKCREGQVVIAALNGEMAVKKLRKVDGKLYLFSANQKFLPIAIGEFMSFEIQGVVKHVIKIMH